VVAVLVHPERGEEIAVGEVHVGPGHRCPVEADIGPVWRTKRVFGVDASVESQASKVPSEAGRGGDLVADRLSAGARRGQEGR
jgi:hypothetical protein